MLLEGVFRHRFSVKPVEPPCESHAMVPRQCTGIDLSVQFLIALRRKELVFVGSHVRDDTAIFRNFEHNNLDALYPLPEGMGFTARVIKNEAPEYLVLSHHTIGFRVLAVNVFVSTPIAFRVSRRNSTGKCAAVLIPIGS